MEINQDHWDENLKDCFFRPCYRQGSSHYHLLLAETARQRGKPYSEEKKKGGETFRSALIGSCWHGEAGGGLARSRAPYATELKSTFGFLWVVLSWKLGQESGEAGSHWTSFNHFGLIAAAIVGQSWIAYLIWPLFVFSVFQEGGDFSVVWKFFIELIVGPSVVVSNKYNFGWASLVPLLDRFHLIIGLRIALEIISFL